MALRNPLPRRRANHLERLRGTARGRQTSFVPQLCAAWQRRKETESAASGGRPLQRTVSQASSAEIRPETANASLRPGSLNNKTRRTRLHPGSLTKTSWESNPPSPCGAFWKREPFSNPATTGFAEISRTKPIPSSAAAHMSASVAKHPPPKTRCGRDPFGSLQRKSHRGDSPRDPFASAWPKPTSPPLRRSSATMKSPASDGNPGMRCKSQTQCLSEGDARWRSTLRLPWWFGRALGAGFFFADRPGKAACLVSPMRLLQFFCTLGREGRGDWQGWHRLVGFDFWDHNVMAASSQIMRMAKQVWVWVW